MVLLPNIVLYVLPTAVAVCNDASQEPIIMTTVPNFVVAARNGSFLFIQPKRVKFREATIGNVKHELTFRLYYLCITILYFLLFVIFLLKDKAYTTCHVKSLAKAKDARLILLYQTIPLVFRLPLHHP